MEKSEFSRELDQNTISMLKDQPLFCKLNYDIKRGEVFPAIRGNNDIDFYHVGRRLFHFSKGGFKTNIKFASVIDSDYHGDITEKYLKDCELITDFVGGYEQIKENCMRYSEREAAGLSYLLNKFSFAKTIDAKQKAVDEKIVALDIEIVLNRQTGAEPKKSDRIDLLILNKETSLLQFVEAKLYKNNDLRPSNGNKPKVVDQVNYYNKQIQARFTEILKEYIKYIKCMKTLFNVFLPEPKGVFSNVMIYIYDFDSYQLDGRLKKDIRELEKYEIEVCKKGDHVKIEHLGKLICKKSSVLQV